MECCILTFNSAAYQILMGGGGRNTPDFTFKSWDLFIPLLCYSRLAPRDITPGERIFQDLNESFWNVWRFQNRKATHAYYAWIFLFTDIYHAVLCITPLCSVRFIPWHLCTGLQPEVILKSGILGLAMHMTYQLYNLEVLRLVRKQPPVLLSFGNSTSKLSFAGATWTALGNGTSSTVRRLLITSVFFTICQRYKSVRSL